MNTVKKQIVLMGLLSVLRAIPTMAQIPNKVTFDAPSAFYAGNAKMPAGSYAVTQPDIDDNLLLIEDASASHSAYVEFIVAPSNTPHAKTDVTFNKYTNVDFLSAIWIEGRTSEMQILPSKAEQKAAKAADAEKHSLSASNAGETTK
jgi:aspartate/glutamate racemase